ncbi:hypothetical protein PLICRDRAFT_103273 [Plicaturopsis crispa FD-325 SS-3]|nr:hypothetical protein PLICRDRAFT_103273 [Plicaturopsis crispa FD-325 SS-3]
MSIHNIMPVQASAVPCERVFSSSKATDTDQRNSLSPVMMEMLQILKYSARSDRLDFANEWSAKEEELWVLDIDPSVLQDIMSRPGRMHELIDLLRESHEEPPASTPAS